CVARRRMRVAVVYGGRSGEHEVSVESARSVLEAIDRARHDVVPIAITQDGTWLAAAPDALLGGEAAAASHILPTAEPASREVTHIDHDRGDLASLGGRSTSCSRSCMEPTARMGVCKDYSSSRAFRTSDPASWPQQLGWTRSR